jgi:hypothetical protein
MANLQFSAQISEQALNNDAVETLIQLAAPANHRVKILRWGVFFDGTQPRNEPVQIRLLRQISSGTADALSLVKLDDSISETVQTEARYNFTSEPTGSSVIESYNIHPQQGIFVPYVLGQEIIVGGGGRLAIDCNAPNDVNARAFIIGEE